MERPRSDVNNAFYYLETQNKELMLRVNALLDSQMGSLNFAVSRFLRCQVEYYRASTAELQGFGFDDQEQYRYR